MDIRIRVALLAIAVNVVLVVVKILLARVSGSTSVRADAFHSLSDVLVSVLVLVGVGLGARGRNRKEGMANWAGVEHVVAIVVGIFILYAAFGIFRQAVSGTPQPLTQVPIALVGIFACVLASFLISRLEIQIGKAFDSPALVADGYHARMNMYTSIGVIVSLVGVMIGLNLDSAAAAIIALLIAVTGVEIVASSVRGLSRGRPIEEFLIYQFVQRLQVRWRGEAAPEGNAGQRVRLPWRAAVLACLAILLLAWLTSTASVARPGERLLIYRFGRVMDEELGPGLHFHLPWPFERGRVVQIGKVRRLEIGFRTTTLDYTVTDRSYQWESRHTSGAYTKKLEESIMLSGDINLVDINSVVQYRVLDARRFLLAAEHPDGLVRVASETALRRVVAQELIDDLLTRDRYDIEDRCKDLIQSILDPYRVGIEMVSVRLQDVHPPLEVVASFRDVASAREDRSRLVNEAYAYRNQVLPRARGEAQKQVLDADASARQRVDHAAGEAGRFLMLLKEYERAPEVTETRLQLEVLEQILPGVEKFLVEPKAGEEPVDLRFFRGTPPDILGGS